MITSVAFVPSAPFLLPELGGGPADLRWAIDRALQVLTEPVTVLGAAPVAGPIQGTPDATPWGAPGAPASDPLPLALAVGCALVGSRPHAHVGVSEPVATSFGTRLTGAVLVVGDGSARRNEKAPGHLDARAQGYDARCDAALATGDVDGLMALDTALGAELLVGGLLAWRALAAAVEPVRSAELLWSGAPYGVHYAVATWLFQA